MTPEDITDQLKTSIEYLSDLCLENAGVYRKYSDKDMALVVLIFQEVFMAKMHDAHSDELDKEGMIKLAEEAGKSIHQTVKLFTKVNLKNI